MSILKKIKKFLLRGDNVGRVVADFDKSLKRLDAIATANTEAAADKQASIQQLITEREECRAEADRARNIAARFAAFIA